MSRQVTKRNHHFWSSFGLALLLLVLLVVMEGHAVEAATLYPTRRTTSIKDAAHVGVNYLTLYHLYDTPAATLQRDFAKFKSDGVNTIVIVMYWYRIESSKGLYNQAYINNVIRVTKTAADYGLSVMIDFHTLIGDNDAWSNPDYVGSGANLIAKPEIASAYVAMVSWSVTQLKGLPNIWSYSLLNEPWYWPLDASKRNSWITLTVSLSNTVRQITGKPVTVRFVASLFERDWAWNSTLMNGLDFISLNAYVWPDAPNDIYWRTFDDYRAKLGAICDKATALGKQVQITEFGSEAADDTLQSADYLAYTNIFKATQNLSGWLSYGWDCAYDPNNPTWTAIGTYSLISQASGIVRQAYSILVGNR
jgi:hypothetical protein